MENQQHPKQNDTTNQRFESDTQKLVHRHMADPNHVISDEELRNVRVGMSPPPDEPTQQAIDEAKDRVADKKSTDEENTVPGAQKMTPWDTIE